MNLKAIKDVTINSTKLLISKGKLVCTKHAPAIYMIAGGLLVLGGTVAACLATLKIDDILYEHAVAIGEINDETSDDDKASKKRAIVTIKTIGKIGRNYIPAIALDVASALCFRKSYMIFDERLTQSLLAYGALDSAFRAYREKVASEHGEKSDLTYITNEAESDLTYVDDGSGIMKEIGKSPFIFRFNSETSEYFDRPDSLTNEPHMNLMFLRQVERYCNDQLNVNGHLFLNEVLDQLGMKRIPAGALVGWLSKDKGGRGYVEFNVYDNYRYYVKNVGNENGAREYVLNMNVDPGVIWDKIV